MSHAFYTQFVFLQIKKSWLGDVQEFLKIREFP